MLIFSFSHWKYLMQAILHETEVGEVSVFIMLYEFLSLYFQLNEFPTRFCRSQILGMQSTFQRNCKSPDPQNPSLNKILKLAVHSILSI